MHGNISVLGYIFLKMLYLLFGLYIVVNTYRHIKENKKLTLFDFFNGFYLIVYCIAPFFILDKIKNGDYFRYLQTNKEQYYFFTAFATIIVYFIVKFIYTKLMNVKTEKIKIIGLNVDVDSNKFLIINLVLLVFSWICLFLWTYKYGSIFGIFEYASAIRDGLKIENKFAFLSKFCAFFAFLTYDFLLILIKHFKKKDGKGFIALIGFIFSLFGTYIYMINIDSRGYIVIFFLVLILFFIDKKIVSLRFKNIIVLVILGFFSIFMVSHMEQITHFIQTGEVKEYKSNNNFFVKEYSYVYTNNVNVFNFKYSGNYDIKYRFLDNIKEIPFAWLPTSMKPDSIVNLNDYNTSFYRNATGELPADIVTASIYTFGLLGLLLYPILYSVLICLLDKQFNVPLEKMTNFQKIIYYYLGWNLMMRFVVYTDIAPLLTSFFGFIIFYFIILFAFKSDSINKKKVRAYEN